MEKYFQKKQSARKEESIKIINLRLWRQFRRYHIYIKAEKAATGMKEKNGEE